MLYKIAMKLALPWSDLCPCCEWPTTVIVVALWRHATWSKERTAEWERQLWS